MSDERKLTREQILRVWRSQYPKFHKRIEHMEETIEMFLVGDYKPPAPFLDHTSKVISLGSCFSDEVAKSLQSQGVQVSNSFIWDGWGSTFAVRNLLKYVIAKEPFPEGYLQDDALLQRVSPALGTEIAGADLFVLTLGFSTVWFETASGRQVLEPTKFNTDRGMVKAFEFFEMKQTSEAENIQALLDIIGLIRSTNPKCAIVLTLSPVPLLASLSKHPPIAANAISKGVLRGALHNVYERNLPGVYYWPSYEFVTWHGSTVEIVFGREGNDLRHVSQSLIDSITSYFRRFYFKPFPAQDVAGVRTQAVVERA